MLGFFVHNLLTQNRLAFMPNFVLENETRKLNSINEKSLRSLLYKAIRVGIKSSGKLGSNYSCGGKVFVTSME
jgi:hypothetical protein